MSEKRLKTYVGLLLLLVSLSPARGQESIQDSSIALGLLQISYRGLMPGGDMADRFGYSSALGVDLAWKFENQFYAGIGGHAWFSEAIQDTQLLRNLSTGGFLIGDNGQLTDVRILGSGFVIPIKGGRQFTLPIMPNPNTGFYLEVGGQFLYHHIKMNPQSETVSAIDKEYAKGYDRLVYGFGLVEGFGFRYLGSKGYLNFSIGLELSQNFTRGRRSLHFDTGQVGTEKRLDLLGGLHFSWIFPLYERAASAVYYR